MRLRILYSEETCNVFSFSIANTIVKCRPLPFSDDNGKTYKPGIFPVPLDFEVIMNRGNPHTDIGVGVGL